MSHHFVHISLDAERLAQLKLSSLPPTDGRHQVRIGVTDTHAKTYTFVTAADALAISEAWRTIEQAILEREHGVAALTDAQADRLLADVRALTDDDGWVRTPGVTYIPTIDLAGE